ncbi:quinolinate synthase NadA [Collinsella tanakaei]|nr:quinolinate synthase NadA [Collinsella tanakaei]
MSQDLAAETAARIEQLKKERDAVVLAHYYVPAEVQAVADYVGDSFALAKLAVDLPQKVLVIAGVEFMGESMKLLNPAKTVLMPEPAAGCPMAHMVREQTIADARATYGDDVAVVCYVNSTAHAKSLSDVCVTSSNAVPVVRALPQHHILFIPDQNLGRYVAEQVPQKHIILNDGCCPFHNAIAAGEVASLKEAHPAAKVLAHPECTREVLELADCIGSTAEIIAYAAESAADEFIVVTMEGVAAELARRCGAGKRFWFVHDSSCPEMDKITLERVRACLEDMSGAVELPDEATCTRAAAALTRMLEVSGR